MTDELLYEEEGLKRAAAECSRVFLWTRYLSVLGFFCHGGCMQVNYRSGSWWSANGVSPGEAQHSALNYLSLTRHFRWFFKIAELTTPHSGASFSPHSAVHLRLCSCLVVCEKCQVVLTGIRLISLTMSPGPPGLAGSTYRSAETR